MQNIIETLLKSKIFPAMEFSIIISLIIVTYWGMYISGFRKVRSPVRFLLSMCLALTGYMIAKFVVVSTFGIQTIPDTAYAF